MRRLLELNARMHLSSGMQIKASTVRERNAVNVRAAKALILTFPGMFRQHLRLSLQQEKLMENLVDEVLQNFARKSPEFISDNDEEKHAAIGEALKVVNKEAVQNASRNGSEPVQIGQNSTKGRENHTRGAGSPPGCRL